MYITRRARTTGTFLTPQQFTARFGPTVEQYDEVLRFAHDYGLEVVGGSRDRMEVQVKGTAGAVETAFHVNMVNYQHPVENRIFYSADREPTPNLSFSLWHVSGLDNYSIPKPRLEKRSDFAAKRGIDARRGGESCHHGVGTVGLVFGQRHESGLLWRDSADWRGAEPGAAGVLRYGPGGPDHVLYQCAPDQ